MINRLLVLAMVVMSVVGAGCNEKETTATLLLTSFEPLSGDYQTAIHIHGANFGTIQNTEVRINQRAIRIESVTSTEIVAVVLPGTQTGNISVTSDGRTVTAPGPFDVTCGSWNYSGTVYTYGATNLTSLSFSVGNKGYVHTSFGRNPVQFVEIDAGTGFWMSRTPLSLSFFAGSAIGFGTSDKGYIIQAKILWEYDPIADQWSQKAPLPDFVKADNFLTATFVKSINKGIVLNSKGLFLFYDPANDSWTQASNPVPFAAFLNISSVPLCRSTEGKTYVQNGSTIWEWTALQDQWTQLPVFPNHLVPNYGFTVGQNVYFGCSDTDNLWVFKPGTSQWIQKYGVADHLRSNPVSFTINNTGYFGMGTSVQTGSYWGDLYQYRPGN